MKRSRPNNKSNDDRKQSFDPDDMGGIVTETPLIPMLYKVLREQYMIKNMFSKKKGRLVYLCSDLCLHVGQNDAWSCGYRNLQMLLSVLIPTIVENDIHNENGGKKKRHGPACDIDGSKADSPHSSNTSDDEIVDGGYCTVVEVVDLTNDENVEVGLPQERNYSSHANATLMTNETDEYTINPHYTLHRFFPELKIPNLKSLQSHIEQAWRQGFDPEGAQHYHGALKGKKEWIGAAEVASLLNYFSINATVVQFINNAKSRSVLGSFVYWYFSQPEMATASDILKMAERFTASEIPPTGIIQCSKRKFPLYLQWEGHSVSIIGIDIMLSERNSSGPLLDPANVQFLLFDPQRRGSVLEAKMLSGKSWRDSIILPMTDLLHKDCQVIHCSAKMLSGINRFHLRTGIRGLTACGHS